MIQTAKAALVVAALASSADAFQLSGVPSQTPLLRGHVAAASRLPSSTKQFVLNPKLRGDRGKASFLAQLRASGTAVESSSNDVGDGDSEMYTIARVSTTVWPLCLDVCPVVVDLL